ncbi:MAG: hypothetical protein SGILL_006628 [Bacillariaceae sp.]
MLTGTKEICVELLKNALARYLVIDGNEVGAKLLSEEDGNLSFSNVKVVPRKMEWSTTKEGDTIFLLIEGEISKLSIGWKWSSFLLLEDAGIHFEGLKLSARILVEKTPEFDVSSQNDNASAKDEKQSHHKHPHSKSTPKTSKAAKQSMFHTILREYDSFIDSLQDILPTSTMLQRVIYHITNILSVTMKDVEVVLNFLEDVRKIGKAPFQLLFGLKQFEFLPLAPGSTNGKRRFSTVETHRLAHVGIDSFYMDVMVMHDEHETVGAEQWNRLPIVAPFTYAAMIRRVYGMRFVDNFYGFEILGVPTENERASIQYDDNHGVTVNFRGKQLQAIYDVQELLFGGSVEDEEEPITRRQGRNFGTETENVSDNSPKMKLTTTLTKILRYVLCIMIIISLYFIYMNVRATTNFDIFELWDFSEEKNQDELWSQRLSIVWHLLVISCSGTAIRYSFKFLEVLDKPLSQGWLQGMNSDEIMNNPAVFRLPMSFLTIYAPGDLKVDLCHVALVGRLDFSVFTLTADTTSIVSSTVTSEKGLRLEGNEMRMLVNDQGVLLNLDDIHDLYIPEKLQIIEPVQGTVLRYRNGILRLKFNSIVGVKLNMAASSSSTDVPKKKKKKRKRLLKKDALKASTKSSLTRKTSSGDESKPGQEPAGSILPLQLDKKEVIREKISHDFKTELRDFRDMARALERIPVKTHVHNLHLYKDSFRGSAAVDWILEKVGFVKTRLAAIELARQMQADFSKSCATDTILGYDAS